MRSAGPCYLRPTLAEFQFFFEKTRRQRSGRVGGRKTGYVKTSILHDTCEISIMSINKHHTSMKLGKEQ